MQNPPYTGTTVMLYIIDSRKKFVGHCVSSISDGIHVDYTRGLTFEQYREAENNPHLVTVSEERMHEMIAEHRAKLCGKFKEISERKYWELLECVPPARSTGYYFFVGEGYQYDLHEFCFKKKGRYFMALRGIRTPSVNLDREIARFQPMPRIIGCLIVAFAEFMRRYKWKSFVFRNYYHNKKYNLKCRVRRFMKNYAGM